MSKVKALNASNTHYKGTAKAGPMSGASAVGLGKFHNADIVHFKLKMHVYELIRGALA